MTVSLGGSAPEFDLLGVDGHRHTLRNYADAELLTIIQSCNHCPYVLAWEDRMIGIQRDYAARGVRVVAVNSNDPERKPEDSYERMIAHAQEMAFPFDYLHDADQSLAHALGAQRTPEVFLFDSDRQLVYHGAIDDSREASTVEHHYLRDALDALLAHRAPELAQTEPVGCTVKWFSP
jgi:peroxiredoxin